MLQVTRYTPDEVAACDPGPSWGGVVACRPDRGPKRLVAPAELPFLPPSLLARADDVRYPYAFVVPGTTPVEHRVAVLNALVRQDLDDPDLAHLARDCVRASDGTPRGIAQVILDMQNQRIAYVNDPGRLEVFQSARYSLARRRGDCEDKAVFFAVIATLSGLRCVVCWLDQPPPSPNNHVAPRVCLTWLDGHAVDYVPAIWDYRERTNRHRLVVTCPPKYDASGTWVWAETTLRGARVGEHPYDALRRLGTAQRAHL